MASNTALVLTDIPNVTDPETYKVLLNLSSAVQSVTIESGTVDTLFRDFLDRLRSSFKVTVDYTVVAINNTIEVDASSGAIVITMLLAGDASGYTFNIKRVDTSYANTVTIITSGGQLIDTYASIKVSTLSSYTLKTNSTNTGWNIL